MITLATAHPAKFATAIERAGLETPALPPHLADLFQREERYAVVPNSLSAVQRHMLGNLLGNTGGHHCEMC